jgi:glycosyltransferase involved in cell wall biosynthesis
MRVLHLSIYDRFGGACIAGYRQHQALRRAGVDSQMFVRYKVTNDLFVHEFNPPSAWRIRIPRVLRRKVREWRRGRARLLGEMFTSTSEHGGVLMTHLPEADIVNVQFAWDFLDYPSFFSGLPQHVPVVVTIHEMATFTGGCSYAESCQGFLDRCGNCPRLGKPSDGDLSRNGWMERQEAFAERRKGNLYFVADSQWLKSEAQRSSLLNQYPISTIHYGLDYAIFKPLNREFARASFGIPVGSRVVSFAAASVTDPRKGIRFLVEAIQGMKEKPFLLTWGRSVPEALAGIPQLHLGNIDSEHLMALAYNASDVFVMPSQEEAFGQTALESIACGTPVAAFKAGGIPETVRHEQTGLLSRVGDAKKLRQNIERLLGDQELWRHCSENGPKVAKAEFSYEVNARNYIALYESLLEPESRRINHGGHRGHRE